MFRWKPATSGICIPQGCILGPVLSSDFINDTDSASDITLGKLACDTKGAMQGAHWKEGMASTGTLTRVKGGPMEISWGSSRPGVKSCTRVRAIPNITDREGLRSDCHIPPGTLHFIPCFIYPNVFILSSKALLNIEARSIQTLTCQNKILIQVRLHFEKQRGEKFWFDYFFNFMQTLIFLFIFFLFHVIKCMKSYSRIIFSRLSWFTRPCSYRNELKISIFLYITIYF